MSARVVLQIPTTKDLKLTAELAAKDYGFSSLQEILRLFLTKLARKEVGISFIEKTITLSKKSAKRYEKMDKDFANQENIYRVNNSRDLLSQLT